MKRVILVLGKKARAREPNATTVTTHIDAVVSGAIVTAAIFCAERIQGEEELLCVELTARAQPCSSKVLT
jgi:hypothetical protein